MKRLSVLLGAALYSLHFASALQSPPVRVSLQSSWTAPPLLAEILETVSSDNPSAFFTFLERLSESSILTSPQQYTAEAIYNAAIQIALDSNLLHGSQAISQLQLKLALHSATPKLEAYYNYYRDQGLESRAGPCESWVDWYGEAVCDVERLKELAGHEAIGSEGVKLPQESPKLLTFDHVYPPPELVLDRPPRTAIFYASLTSPNFRELHNYLARITDQPDPRVEYVFRYVPPKQTTGPKSGLSGYGVALDLKKTDYLAVDDRGTAGRGKTSAGSTEDKSGERTVDIIQSLIQSYPESAVTPADTPLSEEEISTLSDRAIQLISESSQPLTALAQLSQNFPKYATALARRVTVNASVEAEIEANTATLSKGLNVLWVNGIQTQLKDSQPFQLLDLLQKEQVTIDSLTSLGFSRLDAFRLLTHNAIFASHRGPPGPDAVFDASDRPEGGDVIVWWNDFEKDHKYSLWSPSLYGLLQPMFPGSMPKVKANLFNVVLILDLSSAESINFISGTMATIIKRDFPIRFGLVPVVEKGMGRRMAKLFYYLVENFGRKKTLAFLQSLASSQPPHQPKTIEWHHVEVAYDMFVERERRSNPETKVVDFEDLTEGYIEESVPLTKVKAYTDRLDASLSTSPQGHTFFNGKHIPMNMDFLQQLQGELGEQMGWFQERVYDGTLTDDSKPEEFENYIYDLPTTSQRRNKHIFPSSNPGSLRIFNIPDLFEKTHFRTNVGGYFYPGLLHSSYLHPESENSITETTYVLADFDTEEGLDLAREAILSLNDKTRTRLSFIHNPDTKKAEGHPTVTSKIISHLVMRGWLSNASHENVLAALGLAPVVVDQETSSQSPLTRLEAIEKLTGITEEFRDYVSEDYVRACRRVAKRVGFAPGESGLLVNGRVVGPIKRGEFRTADFHALEEYEYRKRVEPVEKAIRDIAPEESKETSWFTQAVSMATSIIQSSQLPDPSEIGLFEAPPRPRQRPYELLQSKHTSFQFGDNSTALHRVALILDPISEVAQKWSSLVKWLVSMPEMFIEVHLQPGHHNEVPIKRFYRSNLRTALSFDTSGAEIPSSVVFRDLPIEPIYTLAMDVPTSWLVRPREALYDLDNIQLGKLFPGDNSVDAIFQLDFLVIEGHARETVARNAPRGVQLELTRADQTVVDDTQVVANLGYFQLKAKPGVFNLEIRKGRGDKTYSLDSAGNEGWDSPTVEEVGSEITVTSFEGLTLYPRVTRKPGMERADVLAEEKEATDGPTFLEGLSSKVKSFFGAKEKPSTDLITVKPQADINIFTVASGLLYERFVGIMILSVLRNTNSTVKFWFIENFLSPAFLEFIPHMAEKYNFQYELVTYKWPSWLRPQKEKQRIIWAYKILFLDVLFPMDLKKVIFVDADQIVRADLKELVDLDLHGAPYGYTPMGDDNTDMEGFRFWKTGYWKDFLDGKPYHISALYVVDLVRFRQLAAGDILRGQYQQLSADPNSLANLDQDLPNNLQRQVPIHSLHEDWLWCETWCSKDRLHRAKTIDLCQNPLTKEPKLSRARQIPEWEEYDAEIARFTRELASAGKIHSRMATADANVLAGGSTGAPGGDKTLGEAKDVEKKESDIPARDEL